MAKAPWKSPALLRRQLQRVSRGSGRGEAEGGEATGGKLFLSIRAWEAKRKSTLKEALY